MSQFTRAYSEFSEAVKFEARLYIDGRLLAYVWHEDLGMIWEG